MKLTATAPSGETVTRSTDASYHFTVVQGRPADEQVSILTRAMNEATEYAAQYALPIELRRSTYGQVLAYAGNRSVSNLQHYGITEEEFTARREELLAEAQANAAKGIKRCTAKAAKLSKEIARVEAVEGGITYQAVSWHSRRDLAEARVSQMSSRRYVSIVEVNA